MMTEWARLATRYEALRLENARLQRRIDRLLSVCDNFLLRWKRSGPDGSAQWEKLEFSVGRIQRTIERFRK